MFDDLRQFIQQITDWGECRAINGADCDLEIGAITVLKGMEPDPPLLLFDNIRGYPPGYRVASNLFTSAKHTALGLGLPLERRGIGLVRAWRDKIKGGIKLVPPITVKHAPVTENVHTGAAIDLLEFPAPKWHELDGGRYIGTGSMTITRDPDEGWVNLACQRVQVHDKNTATIFMTPGHHADIMRKKYWAKGQGCPVAVSIGQDPMLWAVSTWPIPWGVSEYDYAGGLRDAPVEVIHGISTDLPVPAHAEIVLEGELVPPEIESRVEGPFGEWPGYYSTGLKPEAAFKIKSIMHRNDPIIQGNPPHRLPSLWSLGIHIQRAAVVWDELDRQIPGVKGVWIVEEAGSSSILAISLKQEYPGHAKQAAMIAAGVAIASINMRFIIVVDDDVDPANLSEVIWAMGTRTDLDTAIDITPGCRSSTTDPTLPPEKRRRGELTHSMGIIIACRPYHWIKDFPPAIQVSPELARKTREKWSELFPASGADR